MKPPVPRAALPAAALCLAPAIAQAAETAEAPASAPAEDRIIWAIGREDDSHREFALFRRWMDFEKSFPAKITCRPDNPASEKNWPAVQPGPLDGWGGSKPHPAEIHFDLPDHPGQGHYLLRLDLVGSNAWNPGSLLVEIGGQKRWIALPRGVDDGALIDPARGNHVRFDLPLESSLFKKGANILRVQPTRSWVIWDALRLTRAGTRPVPADTFDLQPLPLFKKSDHGLLQPARLSMVLLQPFENLVLRLQSGSHTRSYPLDGSRTGTLEQSIDIPEITAKGHLACTLLSGSRPVLTKKIPVRPARKWTIHVVPQAHVDIGYTDLQERAMEVHRKSNDRAIELVKEYPEFLWSVESSYVLEDWLRTRPPELAKEFFALTRSRKIEVGAFYSNLLTGLVSDEEAFRSLYYSKKLSRQHGVPFRSATLTDSPSHVWSVPTLLAKSGVKYLSMGINQGRAPLLRGGLDKQSPVWWQGPDGSRVLAFFHDHYAWAGKVGLTDAWSGRDRGGADLRLAEVKIPWLLSLYDRPEYPYNTIHLHGAYGDNRPLTGQLPRTVRAWNQKYLHPRIVFSTNTEWFSRIEKDHGHQLQTVTGDGGAYWEDGAASSALETALNRRNQRQALLAEFLLTGLHAQGKIHDDHRAAFADIWHHIMLYNEHTWGAHNSISRPDLPEVKEQFRYKAQFAHDASAHLQPLLAQARAHLPEEGARENPAPAARWSLRGDTLRTPGHLITLDRAKGAIKSITDLRTKQELLDPQAPHLCGQVIYARNPKPPYDLTAATCRDIALTPRGLRVRLAHPMMPAITLLLAPGARDPALLEFRYHIQKTETREKEGIYVAFPLAGKNPAIDYAVANATVRAGRDWLPGACKDWFAVQNWLRVRNRGFDILWISYDSPLINLQGINSNKWLEKLPLENGHLYAYIMNNYWFTNYKASQGGKLDFRFALASAETIPAATAHRLGRDWSPAEQRAIDSMVAAAPANILVSGFKRSEDGQGYIVRLREMEGRPTQATLRLPALAEIKKATLANGVEDPLTPLPLKDGAITLRLKPHDHVTIKVE